MRVNVMASLAKPRRRSPKVGVRAQVGRSSIPTRDNFTKAVSRALEVLEYFPDGDTRLSLSEISKLVQFHESTLFRILLTLEGHGYLLRNDDGTFRLTPKLLLGRLHEKSEKVRKVVRPFLESLSQSFNETTSLKFLFESRIQVIDFVKCFQEIGVTP